MEGKKRDFGILALILVIIISLNMAVFYFKVKPVMSGMAITNVEEIIPKINFSFAAFIINWLLVILIIIVSYMHHLKKKKEEAIKVVVENKSRRGLTDIDLLYSLLKDKKTLQLSLIAKAFRVNKEKALEWCKILENHNLALINYPALSEPEVEVKL